MELELSIILPTVRPKMARICVDRIKETTNCSFEIIVVSPLDIGNLFTDCHFIQEESKQGCVKAFNLGEKKAQGTYIINMSDEQLVEQGCLDNIIKQMREHDNELYMCGPRTHNLWGNTPEQLIYDHYYPLNPCIKRANISKIGGVFFDPHFTSYYIDPDVALRVIHAGGKVEICPTAWTEVFITNDQTESEKRTLHFEEDHKKFVTRWDSIFGNGQQDSSEINKGVFMIPNAESYEICSRLIGQIRDGKDDNMVETFIFLTRYSMNTDHLPLLLAYALANLDKIPHLVTARNCPLQRVLFSWIMKRMPQGAVLDFKEVDQKVPQTPYGYRGILMACYIMFAFRLQKETSFTFIKNFKGYDISYNNGMFHGANCQYPTLTELLMHIIYDKPSTPDIDFLEMRILEEFIHHNKGDIREKVYSAIDYFGNKSIEEARNAKIQGRFWNRVDWE